MMMREPGDDRISHLVWKAGRAVSHGAVSDDHPDEVSRAQYQLRRWILSGELAAGSALSQVDLAKRLGVSRGPLREALRLLQNDGLVSQESQHRPRVVELATSDLDQLCAIRMLLGSHAVAIALPHQTDESLDRAERLIDEMLAAVNRDDLDHWRELDDRLHVILTHPSGKRIETELARLTAHAARYRQAFLAGNPDERAAGDLRNRAIVAAIRDGAPTRAARLYAEHLSNTGLLLLREMSPEFEPAHIIHALSVVTAADASR